MRHSEIFFDFCQADPKPTMQKMKRVTRDMWRFLSAAFWAGAVALALSACQPATTLNFAFQPTPQDTVTVNLRGVSILVGGSAVYCPTPSAKRRHNTGVTVTLRPCSPDGAAAREQRQAGLMLVNILDAQDLVDLADAEQLHGYFTSEAGRKALSNDGDPSSVEILGTLKEDGVFYTHTRHATGPIVPDIDNVRWRGFFVLRGRLVSISILSFVDNPMPDGIVFAQLSEFAQRLKYLNP